MYIAFAFTPQLGASMFDKLEKIAASQQTGASAFPGEMQSEGIAGGAGGAAAGGGTAIGGQAMSGVGGFAMPPGAGGVPPNMTQQVRKFA